VLSANHERGPYILAGLSIGALTARLFAAEYPQEAAGLVLLDHAFLNPGSAPRSPLNQPVVDSPDSPPRLLEMVLPNITAEDDPGFANLPERLKALHYWATARHPPLPTVLNAQTCEAAVDAATEGKTTPLGKLPLVVISTENDTPGYAELQRHLLSLSTSSQQLIAKKSFHAIEMSEPAVAVAAIRAAVDAARAP
jgi:pimeloyl-ACP methyl ester carboxylesterase